MSNDKINDVIDDISGTGAGVLGCMLFSALIIALLFFLAALWRLI